MFHQVKEYWPVGKARENKYNYTQSLAWKMCKYKEKLGKIFLMPQINI